MVVCSAMAPSDARGGRIVLFGATGYTGRLVAESLASAGTKPLLAARRPDALESLATELGGLETARADVEEPATIGELLGPGDVLVTTVGPFIKLGEPAARAAIEAGAV